MNKLDQLRAMTDVVADTGDIEAIETYRPHDATTNPSLLLKAVQLPRYETLVRDCVRAANLSRQYDQDQLDQCVDNLLVSIAREILAIVPGRVSLEVDARLSFDTGRTLNKARNLIELLRRQGIARERVLIKIAATWEGIQAARQLEQEGINCNLTLLFGFAQAAACAEAGVFLISPFVGRIMDWYKANTDQQNFLPAEDPGVRSLKRIYDYYKQHNYRTIVMGASFRNSGEIEELAGCDKLTISPALLSEMSSQIGTLSRKLHPNNSPVVEQSLLIQSEAEFRWSMNNDAMATEKLAEGIRNFAVDQLKLEQLLVQFAQRKAS